MFMKGVGRDCIVFFSIFIFFIVLCCLKILILCYSGFIDYLEFFDDFMYGCCVFESCMIVVFVMCVRI